MKHQSMTLFLSWLQLLIQNYKVHNQGGKQGEQDPTYCSRYHSFSSLYLLLYPRRCEQAPLSHAVGPWLLSGQSCMGDSLEFVE